MEDARTEYGLPKIWVKLAHAYTADTRLSSSSPPRAFLESLGTRLLSLHVHQYNDTDVCANIINHTSNLFGGKEENSGGGKEIQEGEIPGCPPLY